MSEKYTEEEAQQFAMHPDVQKIMDKICPPPEGEAITRVGMVIWDKSDEGDGKQD